MLGAEGRVRTLGSLVSPGRDMPPLLPSWDTKASPQGAFAGPTQHWVGTGLDLMSHWEGVMKPSSLRDFQPAVFLL